MRIGIAYNLSSEVAAAEGIPSDRADEFDSLETVQDIEHGIIAAGHEPVRLGFGLNAIARLRGQPVDLVFNIAEGLYGRARESQMPAILDMMKIPYTFSDTQTLSLALDKAMTKQILMQNGINTPAFWSVDNPVQVEALIQSGALKYPLFVKPSCEGSSMGINSNSRVTCEEDLRNQVNLLMAAYPGSSILIEEFLPGREVTVGVIGNREPEVLGMMSFKLLSGTDRDFFYTPEIKHHWEKYLIPECPANLSADEYQKVLDLAIRVFKTLRCRDCARIDMRFDASGEPSFMEINPLAGLTRGKSDIPVMAELMGLSYEDLIGRIIQVALERIDAERFETTMVTEAQRETA
ncbi:MAG: ATP-grasp domain-containing protein [Candidatus Cryosericum sp.]|nr:ATP-grasp domain-containing protein [bacterium]